MKPSLVLATSLLACALSHAQPAPAAGDTWSNVPPASDDRFTNPKSKLYAGPNGWHNFGEVRAEVANAAKSRYAFKTGLNYLSTPKAFVFATNSQTQLVEVDFGTDRPAPGAYEVAAKPDPAQKKVRVSLVDASGGKLLGWQSGDKAGTVAVSKVNGYLYFTARNLRLAPVGMSNTGDLKQPMSLGFEGAVAPE
ncbi:hypothetical protein PMI14_06768 [Acidovorax sp. CF316]|uniref:hypothetical protein n=1 Tax=Acidovorax sp. CF316 TaxID=1144317 RepID=UPI00026BDFD6|nr:hypothetical protein [Acidovorax sp. CF316]EJE48831.1 hypothetical protein PMI14_06768 [Acidovorax sp. CF316]